MDTSIILKINLTTCPYDHRVQSSLFFKETSLCDRDNYRKSQPIKMQSINFFVKTCDLLNTLSTWAWYIYL